MPNLTERFVGNPVSLDISRSKFNLNHKHTFTFKAGELVPITQMEVLPGDTFKVDCSFVCRSTTPIAPVMDDAYIQVEFYFVPNKLLLSRAYMAPQTTDSNHSWAAIIGAQDSLLNMPLPDPDTALPSLSWDTSSASEYSSSPAHYLGYPWPGANVDPSDFADTKWDGHFNPLPLLAYYAVFNENYRDPNLFSPVVFSITAYGSIQFAANSKAGIASATNIFKDKLAHVCREHGYFGSALPWPQRNGSSVSLPLGEVAPVVPMGDAADVNSGDALIFERGSGFVGGGRNTLQLASVTGEAGPYNGFVLSGGSSTSGGISADDKIIGSNLYADLSEATAASVNMLRYAIQLQRLYEAWARGGNRIQDMTQIFGVTPHDMGDDRPEYLGGKRIPLNIVTVPNTAGTTYSTSTQQSIGSTGAFCNTGDSDHYFTKSFDTWGILIGVCLIRHHDTFTNMFQKWASRKTRLDYYWPQFANLGEQPVFLREVQFSNTTTNFADEQLPIDTVFGYQEAYAEYRYIPDRVSGLVNPSFGSVDYWTYASDLVGLVGTGKLEDIDLTFFMDASYQVSDFDQTLQVSSSTAGFQFLAQFYFDITAIRPMPLYSIPGLMDHH